MDTAIIDQDTARAALDKLRHDLEVADNLYHEATDDLREEILDIRPQGIVTVPQMAVAIGRARNYIDTLWSAFLKEQNDGETDGGRKAQTRLKVDANHPAADEALARLKSSAATQRRLAARAKTIRTERDRAVVLVYTSKILGPTSIAAYLGIDRNHVLRIVRNAGVTPVHRTNIKNQYTAPRQLALPIDVSAVTSDATSPLETDTPVETNTGTGWVQEELTGDDSAETPFAATFSS